MTVPVEVRGWTVERGPCLRPPPPLFNLASPPVQARRDVMSSHFQPLIAAVYTAVQLRNRSTPKLLAQLRQDGMVAAQQEIHHPSLKFIHRSRHLNTARSAAPPAAAGARSPPAPAADTPRPARR